MEPGLFLLVNLVDELHDLFVESFVNSVRY